MVFAASVDELRTKITERESEIKKLEAEIAVYHARLDQQSNLSQTLGNEVSRLETQIKKLNADIKLTTYQIQKTGLLIDELNGEISKHEQDLASDREVVAELFQTLYESDNQSLVEAFLSHNQLSDFLGDREATLQLQKNIEFEIVDLKRRKAVLEEERGNREHEESEYQLFKKDLSGKKIAQESVSQTKNQLLRESRNQESRYQQILKEREKRRGLIQKELQSIEEELGKLIDRSLLPTRRSGVLGWPIVPPVVTQGFGNTDFATTQGTDIYKGGGHNGIDFRAAVGTRILSAGDGIVKGIGNTDTICPGGSYGKWILIEHPNNLSTLYAHLSAILVSQGATVKRSDPIGYSGSTGYITGPHLHFTVYASNTYQLRKTKYCGLIPAGGYLNPLDYL